MNERPHHKVIQTIARCLRDHRKILICSHTYPDGDALGSSLALGITLRNMGKTVAVYNTGPIAENLRFLPGVETVCRELPNSAFEVTAIVDCGSLDRVGSYFPPFVSSGKAGTLLCIDHHVSNVGFGDINLIVPEASSTGEIVGDVILAMNQTFSQDVATALYCAICIDTGRFQYPSTGAHTFLLASELVAAGAHPAEISDHLYARRTKYFFHLFRDVLGTLTFHPKWPVVWIRVEQKMLKTYGLPMDVTDGMVEEMRSLDFCEVAVFYKERAENRGYKVSMRSKSYCDVAAICSQFGGGGHVRAAGVDLPGTFSEVHAQIMHALELQMKKYAPYTSS